MKKKKARKKYLNIYMASVFALSNMPGKTGTFEEIAAFIEEKGLFAGRKSPVSLAKEIELHILGSASKFRRWFLFTEPDILKLKDLSDFGQPLKKKE